MTRFTVLRGVSAAAISLACASAVWAQQSLPTIDVGGSRRAAAQRRPTVAPAPTPPASSLFPSEPKTPAQGYVVRNVSTGTKTDVPIMQTPVSVQVVPRQVIRDQQITNLQEAVENVSSVRSNNDDVQGYNFNIRGFQSLNIFRNNLAIPSATPSVYDTANIERIEVLKGPASILYGRSEPGGLINIVTKQPLDAPRYVVEQQIGSFNYYRTQWDFSSPIAQVPGLAYRVSGAYQNSGSFRNFHGGERLVVAPVISYRPSEWTELTLDTQFSTSRMQSDIGIIPIGPNPAPIPLSRSLQEPNDPRDPVDMYNISYKFRQNLNEDWKVTNRFLYTAGDMTNNNLAPLCTTIFCVDQDTLLLQRIAQYQRLAGNTFSTNIDLEGKFAVLGTKHNVLMGLDYLNTYFDYYFGNGGLFDGSGLTAYPLNIFNPIYGTVPRFAYLDGLAGTGYKGHQSFLQRQKGFYVQDQVSFFDDRAHLLIGARYDVADTTQAYVDSVSLSDYSTQEGVLTPTKQIAILERLRSPTAVDTAWSPRVGLLYEILPQLSVYASYSRSFGANNGFTAERQNLGPQRGLQWEAGVKAEPLPGLTATLAVFQVTKSGVPTRDFAGGPNAQKLAGLQRSRGIELDVIGRVTDRLSVIANYSHIDAKVIDDNPVNRLIPYGLFVDETILGPEGGLLGNHLQNAPRHSGKIFATYDFGDNGLGMRVGGGVTASTRAWADIRNTTIMPGWARLDAFASYATLVEGHKVTAQLNLKNINNAWYFTGSDTVFYHQNPQEPLFPAPPFTAIGTLRFEW